MNSIMIGDIKVTGLSDGDFSMPRKTFPEAGEDDAPADIPATLNVFLIEDGTRNILIDTGAGKTFAETLGQLPDSLNANKTSANDITDIFLTHAHLDHVGGLVDNQGQILFKNAQIHLNSDELQFWFNDEIYNSLDDSIRFYFDIARTSLTPYKQEGMIKTFKPNADMGGGIFAVPLKGHTAGHSGYRINSGKDQLLIWGDIIHVPALQYIHPEWKNNFDSDSEIAIQTRQRLLDEVSKDGLLISGMHLPRPHFGIIENTNKGYVFLER
jgi:glyoxylase-like metal-dependent hydrolase (beta-lactamase superfamily II)